MAPRWRRRLLGALCLGALLPPLQVLLLRGVDPPLTLTMVARSWAASLEEGRFVWPQRRWVAADPLPPHLFQALIAAEDANFFEHHGFDFQAIAAAWRGHEGGGPLRGGSTLSQQLAKNVFLWQRRSWLRKGLEAYYTLWLELLVPKRRILEVYVNVAELGPMTFGVEAGARRWFGRPAAELSRYQSSLLVALLPAPRSWKPGSARIQEKARRIRQASVPLPPGAPGAG